MDEELFAQFNKIASSTLHSKSREQQSTVEASPRVENSEKICEKDCEVKSKSSVPGLFSGENSPVLKVKALQVDAQLQSQLILSLSLD